MKKGLFIFSITAGFLCLVLMIINPNVCKDGAVWGLLLCSKVIIPSLFPFSVFALYILKSEILSGIKFLEPITKKLFGMNLQTFSYFLLSLIGGYPIGAKVLNEAVISKKNTEKTAGVMLNYCVNAGPAFVILAVGSGMLGSRNIGYILFASHILSSLILAFLFKRKMPALKCETPKFNLNIIDNFVLSVSQSASSTLSICSYVVLFSVILNYINYYSKKLPSLKILSYFLEVTNGTMQTKNVLLISFLLGFGGICVWCQVFCMARNFKINYFSFVFSRLFHGVSSAVFTYLLLKIFKVSVNTFSNGTTAHYSFTNSTAAVALSLICMGLIFIISLYSKNYAGNLLEDLV